ncbi:Ras family protein [Dokdonia sp. MED134]|uniref:Rab family GTPase n=1 Tax=Dokdonia sp. MED134 TaxID=313590 RepID=UPI000068D0DB|nr:Rab family GTPase [Dokdonia sp. MED134]EAQ39469.1 Ras family protein [Dokdonia sp. MED134]
MSVSKKIVLLGHFGVGKSSLLRRFVENTFSDNYVVTIGVHIMKKEVVVDTSNKVTLIIWDVEGTDDFTKYRPSYLMGASSFVYVFDASRPVTYSDLKYNLAHLKEKHPNVPVHIIGNKVDLVDAEEIKRALEEQEVQHSYLSSAKTGENVEQLFKDVAAQLLENA